MFGPRFQICRLFGIPIYIDLSWFIIAILVTWSLAEGLFANLGQFQVVEEAAAEALSENASQRWGMGVIGALGLFLSVLLHELGHARMAQRFGVPMRGITLFIFGGVAEMQDEPPSAVAEFWVAIAGPLVTLLIMIVGALVWYSGAALEASLPVLAVLAYLTMVNTLLLVFNMLPAFPLDGGRVLRAALWGYKDDLTEATRITSQIGAGFGLALIVLGGLRLLMYGDLIGAIWWFVIGLFLRWAAQMSYQRQLARKVLEGESLHRFTNHDPISVSPDITVKQFIEDYVYRHHHKMYPVVDGEERVLGCITLDRVRQMPREEWAQTPVREVMEALNDQNTIEIDEDPLQALNRLHQQNTSRLLVMDGGELVGIITLKDLAEFLSIKIELEGRR